MWQYCTVQNRRPNLFVEKNNDNNNNEEELLSGLLKVSVEFSSISVKKIIAKFNIYNLKIQISRAFCGKPT